MRIEIVTPDKKIFEGDIKSVRVPGKKDPSRYLKTTLPLFQLLKAVLLLWLDLKEKRQLYEISGGVIEVKANKIILLADSVR